MDSPAEAGRPARPHPPCQIVHIRRTCTQWHPRQLIDGQDGLRIPAVAGPVQQIPGLAEEAEWHGMIPPETHFELPSWIQSAWQALAADEGLATAVNAHYEAVRLDRGHPSVAHLIHVAAIEGFGASFVKGRGVARKRFREALKTVMTEAEAEQLAELAYDLRCATGHTGDLLGSEHTFGYPLGLLFQQTDDLIFDYAILGRLRQASRRVLTKALQDACAPGSST